MAKSTVKVIMIRLGIHGATGRMGKELIKASDEATEWIIAYNYAPNLVGTDLHSLCSSAQVVIDFSHPTALPALLAQAVIDKVPLLIGTTGLDQQHFVQVQQAAQHIPIIYAANTSMGITLLKVMIKALLSQDRHFDINITECHHCHKLDAPSGTALMLQKFITALSKNNVSCNAIRGGSIVGEHEIRFMAEHEDIIITHRAYNRQCFAVGAIKAALWLVDKEPGLFDISRAFIDNYVA